LVNLNDVHRIQVNVSLLIKILHIDYVISKIPRFPFDKFEKGERELGTQMKATGEVMGQNSLHLVNLNDVHRIQVNVSLLIKILHMYVL
jgi:hypothetical protein